MSYFPQIERFIAESPRIQDSNTGSISAQSLRSPNVPRGGFLSCAHKINIRALVRTGKKKSPCGTLGPPKVLDFSKQNVVAYNT